ncbi:MAG: NADH-quinone oxidoreductase subunit [Acidimicrobiaceae bacterium]|jgi:NADH-quinone oxidoreductase subunit J
MSLAAQQVAQNVAFYLLAAGIIFGAIRVVTTNNVVHAALYLVVVLAGVGADFLLLGAEFTGITQILVYVGAIVVLFLFGIMLTRAPIGKVVHLTSRTWYIGAGVAIALMGVMSYALIDAFGSDHIDELGALTPQTTAQVSDSIFTDYLVPFEVSSILLLAALIGAIVIARKE